jgi:hypothetical protein
MTGRLFRNRHRPRVCLDLKVGRSHVVEVLLHLRRSDWEWYRSSHQVIEEELLSLLYESVLPRMFGAEIESYHRKHNPRIFPPEEVGTKNKHKTSKKSGQQNAKNPKKGATASAAVSKKTENQFVVEKKPKDVYYAFGETLQLAYRKHELNAWNQVGSTIFFKKRVDEEDTEFHDRPKLPGRLLVWCSKVDRQNNTNPDPDNVGFFRQEMIPISALFREPKDLE